MAAWLEALGAERVGVHVRGTLGSGTGRVLGVGLALADGRAAYIDVEAMSPADDAALAGWLADPARPKVLHDAKGPMLALAAHGWTLVGVAERHRALDAYLVSPDQRSYDLADLTLRYLHRELQQAGDGDQGMLFDEDGTVAQSAMVHARAVLDLSTSSPTRSSAPAATDCLTEIEMPLVNVLALLEQTGIAVDLDHLESLESALRRRGEAGRRRGVRRDRQGDQPRVAEAAAGGAVRRARHAEDQAHQDRLHDRRRRAAGALRQDRAPVPARTCCGTAT